jgi:hypothetical protein
MVHGDEMLNDKKPFREAAAAWVIAGPGVPPFPHFVAHFHYQFPGE